MVKPQFELGRERVGRGVVRDAADRREAILAVARAAARARPAGARLRLLRPARAEGQPRDLRLVRRRGPAARRPRGGDPRGRGGRREDRGPDHPLAPAGGDRGGGRSPSRVAREAGLAPGRHRGGARQARRRRRGDRGRPAEERAPTSASCSAATARSCTRCAASPAPACPVFGVNFGTVGFLAAVERERGRGRDPRAPSPARSRRSSCRGSRSSVGGERQVGLNDVTLARRPHDRVAELSYRIAGEEVGHVRCDGLVAATPAGSTGYNLANQGPILAWGVKGYVVSYISPHSLTARALVVAPGDVLHVGNAAGREPVEVAVDGGQLRRAGRRARSSRSASSTRSAASPSCRAPASTSGSARSSATWRSEPRPASRRPVDVC